MASGSMKTLLAALAAALITASGAFALGRTHGHHGSGGLVKYGRNLTFAEIHSQRGGKAVVVRIDRGQVKAVGTDSVTITENDGNDVTIPVDDSTRILRYGNHAAKFAHHDTTLNDLDVGDTVVVTRKAGQPAKLIAVIPTGGEHKSDSHRESHDDNGDHRHH